MSQFLFPLVVIAIYVCIFMGLVEPAILKRIRAFSARAICSAAMQFGFALVVAGLLISGLAARFSPDYRFGLLLLACCAIGGAIGAIHALSHHWVGRLMGRTVQRYYGNVYSAVFAVGAIAVALIGLDASGAMLDSGKSEHIARTTNNESAHPTFSYVFEQSPREFMMEQHLNYGLMGLKSPYE